MSTMTMPARDAGRRQVALTALVDTELLKLRTVRAPVAVAAGGVLVMAFLAVQAVIRSGQGGAPSIGTAPLLLSLLSAAGRAQVFALVVGVLAVTAERRHGTLTVTLLQTPRRVRLMAAKALASALAGLLIGLAGLAVVALVAAGSGALRGSLLNGDVILAAAGQLAAYPLYGLLGVGIGTLLSASPPIAVLLPVAWFLLLEEYAGALAGRVSPWLPGHLTSALGNSGEVPDLVAVWAGGLGLLGYGLFLLAAGTTRIVRADVG